jgi:hypothetical protein
MLGLPLSQCDRVICLMHDQTGIDDKNKRSIIEHILIDLCFPMFTITNTSVKNLIGHD